MPISSWMKGHIKNGASSLYGTNCSQTAGSQSHEQKRWNLLAVNSRLGSHHYNCTVIVICHETAVLQNSHCSGRRCYCTTLPESDNKSANICNKASGRSICTAWPQSPTSKKLVVQAWAMLPTKLVLTEDWHSLCISDSDVPTLCASKTFKLTPSAKCLASLTNLKSSDPAIKARWGVALDNRSLTNGWEPLDMPLSAWASPPEWFCPLCLCPSRNWNL